MERYKQTKWDKEKPTDEYFIELCRVSKKQIIWGGNYFSLPMSGVVVWYKGKNLTMKDGEMAVCSFDTFKVFQLARTDAYINCNSEKIHPTQKPTRLYDWILLNYAEKGQTILDTHLGSGSSAIAAHYFGCDFVGCEIDKDYFAAAQKRFKKETAQIGLFNAVEPGKKEKATSPGLFG